MVFNPSPSLAIKKGEKSPNRHRDAESRPAPFVRAKIKVFDALHFFEFKHKMKIIGRVCSTHALDHTLVAMSRLRDHTETWLGEINDKGSTGAKKEGQNTSQHLRVVYTNVIMTLLPTGLSPSYAEALRLIDEAHAADPNKIQGPQGPSSIPYELLYAQQMTKWLDMRSPEASPALQIACRAQHFRRWELPRSSFPMTRSGYLTWRAKQKSQAAAQVAELLGSSTIEPPLPLGERDRVAALIRKEALSTDEETQVLEDVACLVFLDNQLDDFEAKPDIDEDKMIGILRKTWVKMTEQGRKLALGMEFSDRAKMLIEKALTSP